MLPITEAQIRATRKYKAKAYDRVELFVTKGKKDELKAHAASQGETLNGFVNRAIDETMDRENAKGDEVNVASI